MSKTKSEQAVEMYEQGLRYDVIAKELRTTPESVRTMVISKRTAGKDDVLSYSVPCEVKVALQAAARRRKQPLTVMLRKVAVALADDPDTDNFIAGILSEV